jgi:hypothetical protein
MILALKTSTIIWLHLQCSQLLHIASQQGVPVRLSIIETVSFHKSLGLIPTELL